MRGVISIVQAAFNQADDMFGITNPIKGLKKPKAEPRLASITPDEEQAIYSATEPCFGNFLFAAIHTGLRPFCELAKLTVDDVEESERGMMWRVYSSKTKKTRKIPVRPEVTKLTRQLMKTAPKRSGKPIFRNTQGNPWKRMTGGGAIHRNQRKVAMGPRSRQRQILMLFVSAHVCTSHVVGLLD